MIYADQRWIGNHGIGCFARHVLAGLEYRPIPLAANPASPLDPWRLTRALGKLIATDLFLSPGYNSPLFCGSPFIFTLHDLNHIDRPENSNVLKHVYYATVLKQACHRSASILTVSEFSRGRIIEWSGVPPDKVVNVSCGVDPEYHSRVAPYESPFPYLLCVSNRKQHKNEFRVIEAFSRAHIAAGTRLVFTGNPTAELAEYIERKHLTSRVQFVGIVPDLQMPSLYRSAEMLVFPSLYEGFGLPVLEAIACGTPVVTANTSALPEVAGEAALLVDPTSVEQIAHAIGRIAGDSILRQQLREKGLARAAQFSWASTVAKVQGLLTRIATRTDGKGDLP
ncbi:MAG: glycosyltransferase family 1 protein [Acidobacteria bacterium]|nr:MAG: glycosyltransferase family 1 protein [Acidobacteriota bacterium]